MICKEAENSTWSHFWVTVWGLVSWCRSEGFHLALGWPIFIDEISKQFWQKSHHIKAMSHAQIL